MKNLSKATAVSLLIFAASTAFSTSAEAQANKANLGLKIEDKFVAINVQSLNQTGNDWNLLRDSSICFPVIISLTNPLAKEVQVRLEFSDYSRIQSQRGMKSFQYNCTFTIPPKQTISRLRGIPLVIRQIAPGSKERGRIRTDGFMIRAQLIEGTSFVTKSLQLDCPNHWLGSGYSMADVNKHLSGERNLVICPAELDGDGLTRIEQEFEADTSWPIETLPQSCRPLLALNRLVMVGVTPADLSKGQRDAIKSAIEGGLEVYLYSSPDGAGLDWGIEFQPFKQSESGLTFSVMKSPVGRGEYGEGVAPRSLARLGVQILDQELRPMNPSDLTLVFLGLYVLLLVPGVFITFKAQRKQKLLLWVIPLIFLGTVIVVTVVGVTHFGVTKRSQSIAGVYHLENKVRVLQLVEGVFDPLGSTMGRTLLANEELVLDYDSIFNYRSIKFEEQEDGTLRETLKTFPRSLNFKVRTIPLDHSAQLAIPKVRWPLNTHQIVSSGILDKMRDISDVEILDRFGIEPDLRVIGLEGLK